MVKVHTIHTGDERRRKEDYVDNGENLDDFVLLDVNKTEEGVLEILETVERETGMLNEGVDVLNDDGELGLCLGWEELALQHIGTHATFVDDVLTDEHRFFLQLFDGDEDVVADVVVVFQLIREHGDFACHILDEVGIVLNSGFEQGDEHMVTAWVVARISKHLLHRFVERTEVLIAHGDEYVVFENK